MFGSKCSVGVKKFTLMLFRCMIWLVSPTSVLIRLCSNSNAITRNEQSYAIICLVHYSWYQHPVTGIESLSTLAQRLLCVRFVQHLFFIMTKCFFMADHKWLRLTWSGTFFNSRKGNRAFYYVHSVSYLLVLRLISSILYLCIWVLSMCGMRTHAIHIYLHSPTTDNTIGWIKINGIISRIFFYEWDGYF